MSPRLLLKADQIKELNHTTGSYKTHLPTEA